MRLISYLRSRLPFSLPPLLPTSSFRPLNTTEGHEYDSSTSTLSPLRRLIAVLCMNDSCPPSTAPTPRRKSRIFALQSLTIPCLSCIAMLALVYLVFATGVPNTMAVAVHRAYHALLSFNWRASAAFRVTHAMKISIAMSMGLGVLLGVGVGLISGLEPAVVIGVSASMAMGCAFVMSFAILHGVNALRAVTFALFVSVCLPFGFGLGFGVGILVGVFLGLEDPDDIREKTTDFVTNFGDFVRVVTAFTLEIM